MSLLPWGLSYLAVELSRFVTIFAESRPSWFWLVIFRWAGASGIIGLFGSFDDPICALFGQQCSRVDDGD
jgi:hypothetical protein